jgi:hypothetical protein
MPAKVIKFCRVMLKLWNFDNVKVFKFCNSYGVVMPKI